MEVYVGVRWDMCAGKWLAFTIRERWAGFLVPRNGDGGTAEEMGERRGRGRGWGERMIKSQK